MSIWTKLYSNHTILTVFSSNSDEKIIYFKILKKYLYFSEIFVTPFFANYTYNSY